MGVTSLALAREMRIEESLLVRVLGSFVHDGRIALRAGYYATVDHVPKLTTEQRAFFDRETQPDAEQPFVPVGFAPLADDVKRSRIVGIAKAFDTMLARGALVKIGDQLYRGSQIVQIRAEVEAFFETHGRMTMAQFRDLLQTSRKYAVPLMEWFDATGVTVRDGDVRALRSAAATR